MANEANIKRLAEIQQEIRRLAEEGERIADEEKVTFSLSDTPMASGYGIGGLSYVPEGATTDRWGDPIEEEEEDDDYGYREEPETGWVSSANSC